MTDPTLPPDVLALLRKFAAAADDLDEDHHSGRGGVMAMLDEYYEMRWARELLGPTNDGVVEDIAKLMIAVGQFGDLIADTRGAYFSGIGDKEGGKYLYTDWGYLRTTWLDGLADAQAIVERYSQQYADRVGLPR